MYDCEDLYQAIDAQMVRIILRQPFCLGLAFACLISDPHSLYVILVCPLPPASRSWLATQCWSRLSCILGPSQPCLIHGRHCPSQSLRPNIRWGATGMDTCGCVRQCIRHSLNEGCTFILFMSSCLRTTACLRTIHRMLSALSFLSGGLDIPVCRFDGD